jgi:hypothetical protein
MDAEWSLIDFSKNLGGFKGLWCKSMAFRYRVVIRRIDLERIKHVWLYHMPRQPDSVSTEDNLLKKRCEAATVYHEGKAKSSSGIP